MVVWAAAARMTKVGFRGEERGDKNAGNETSAYQKDTNPWAGGNISLCTSATAIRSEVKILEEHI